MALVINGIGFFQPTYSSIRSTRWLIRLLLTGISNPIFWILNGRWFFCFSWKENGFPVERRLLMIDNPLRIRVSILKWTGSNSFSWFCKNSNPSDSNNGQFLADSFILLQTSNPSQCWCKARTTTTNNGVCYLKVHPKFQRIRSNMPVVVFFYRPTSNEMMLYCVELFFSWLRSSNRNFSIHWRLSAEMITMRVFLPVLWHNRFWQRLVRIWRWGFVLRQGHYYIRSSILKSPKPSSSFSLRLQTSSRLKHSLLEL